MGFQNRKTLKKENRAEKRAPESFPDPEERVLTQQGERIENVKPMWKLYFSVSKVTGSLRKLGPVNSSSAAGHVGAPAARRRARCAGTSALTIWNRTRRNVRHIKSWRELLNISRRSRFLIPHYLFIEEQTVNATGVDTRENGPPKITGSLASPIPIPAMKERAMGT